MTIKSHNAGQCALIEDMEENGVINSPHEFVAKEYNLLYNLLSEGKLWELRERVNIMLSTNEFTKRSETD